MVLGKTLAVRICGVIGLMALAKLSWAQVDGQSSSPLLFSAGQWLAGELPTDSVVLDVRSDQAYRAGHLPGAVWVDLERWKRDTAGDQLFDEAYWSQALSALGVDGSRTTIVYGEPLTEAARVWWLLKFAGCRDVRLLDGGLAAFVAAGGELSHEEVVPVKVDFTASIQANRIIQADELLSAGVQDRQCQIVDNRSPEEFQGTVVRGPRGGHIPGAVNSDWRRYRADDGTFLPKEQLVEILRNDGIDLNGPLVTHCQSGARSSVGALVLEMVSGRPVRNYYRSWQEWSQRDDLPIDR